MNIVVCVQHVPDAQGDRTFRESDNRPTAPASAVCSPRLDEYAVETALQLVEADGGEVTVVTMGPDQASDAIRRPCRWAPTRACTSATTLPARLGRRGDLPGPGQGDRRLGPVDLVVTGMASTDGTMGVVPAMLAERLGLPQVTFASEISVADGAVTIRRYGDAGSQTIRSGLPALVSVTDQINEPRYPSFKGIMAAKKKPVEAGRSQMWASPPTRSASARRGPP